MLARSTGNQRKRVRFPIRLVELDVCLEDSVGLCIGGVALLLDEGNDVLRNNRENREAEVFFNVLNRLHRRVEVFDEECQADADHETD